VGAVADRGQVHVLDGNSLVFRAFFALPTDLATASGTVTNAVHGFASMLVNLIRDYGPSAMAVAFDRPEPTFRDEIAPDYKGNRPETPDLLGPQFDLVRAVLDAMAIQRVEISGFEADDVLATLATMARDAGRDVVVVSGDRDTFQLAEDPHVRVLYTRRGISDTVMYDEAGILERTGVLPPSYPNLAALRGDPSDNLPGVPGVGEKTAAKLITTYGDLDGLFAHLDELTPKLRQNLADHVDQVRCNARVIPLVRDVPLEVGLDDLALGRWDPDEVKEVFARLELRTAWERLAPLLGGSSGGDGSGAEGSGGTGGRPVLGPVSVIAPDDVHTAIAVLDDVHRSAAAAGVPVSLSPAWAGDPGRTPPAGLAVAAVAKEAGPEGDANAEEGAADIAERGRGEAAEIGGDRSAVVWLDGGLLTERPLLDALTLLTAADGPGVVAHDAKELMRAMLPIGLDVTGLALDTAVAAYLLDPSSGRYALDEVVERRLGIVLDGEDGVPAPTDGQLALDGPAADEERPGVSARRAVALGRLVEPMRDALDRAGVARLHDEVERPLVRVLARMEVTGIRVDVAELRRIAAELVVECRRLEAEIQQLAGEPFNVNSTPQLRHVLYDRLGLTPGKKTKTGYSTDAQTLEKLRGEHPIVDALLRYREVEKLRSTYGDTLLAEVGPDERIHATFHQTVARTGRLSSDRPNLHNIPIRTEEGAQLRHAFIPAEGSRFLVADYDQIELRVIAHLSGDPGLVAAFTGGRDIHRTTAARVFSVDPDDVTIGQRSKAKMVSYGLAYGMEAFGLAQRLAIPTDEAREILDAYFSAFPAVKAYMEGAVAEARSRGYTETLLGRRRPLPDLHSPNRGLRMAAERQAMNAGIQGLAADLFKVALVRLDDALESRRLHARLVLQVHDEVLVETPVAEQDEVAVLVPEVLAGVGEAAGLSVALRVSVAWGDDWGEAKG
jgi:DNA polymerase I